MKTDRFADSIRRKLESIRPEFTEKDWTQMQSALSQATPPHPSPSVTGGGSMWGGHPWLLAAATVSTVVLMAVSVWQWREINSLRQTVGQLKQQPDIVHTAPTAPQQERTSVTPGSQVNLPERNQNLPLVVNAEQSALRQRDTIYITQRIASPQQVRLATNDETSSQRTESPPEPRLTIETDKPVLVGKLRSIDNKNSNTNPTAGGDSSTSSIEKNGSNLPAITDNNRHEVVQVKNGRLPTSEKRVADLNPSGSGNRLDPAKDREKGQRLTAFYNPVTKATAPNSRKYTSPTSAQPETTSDQEALPADAKKATIAVKQLASLPLSIEPNNWQASLTKRAKSVQLVQPVIVVVKAPEKAPAGQPVQVAPQFRAGVGGAVSSGVWSAGAFAELIVGRHITLGLGLSKATHNNTFINDFDFESRTKRDFRREFARGVDPKRDILTIETRVTRLQLPVSIGYRIPINHFITFLPSIGTNLNLNSTEHVTFYLPTYGPQRGFDEGTLTFDRSVDLLTNFQLVPSLEWQRGRWVAQGSPVFTIPLQTELKPAQAIPGWPQTVLGMRARLLYQF